MAITAALKRCATRTGRVNIELTSESQNPQPIPCEDQSVIAGNLCEAVLGNSARGPSTVVVLRVREAQPALRMTDRRAAETDHPS